MKKEKPLILLSNDDGVEAKGLNELIRGLRGMGEIIVMAPGLFTGPVADLRQYGAKMECLLHYLPQMRRSQ